MSISGRLSSLQASASSSSSASIVSLGSDRRSNRPMLSSPARPFQPFLEPNSFETCMSFLTLPELQRASQVSKTWQQYVAPNHVWEKACLTNQFPLVIGSAHPIQDNVRILYSRVTSGQSLSKTIGRPVVKKDGKIVAAKAGNISQRVFNMMVPPGIRISANMRFRADPFDPSKPIDLVFQCEFRFVERVLGCEALPYKLDESGNLIPITGHEEPPTLPKLTVIPLSTRNLRVLTQHPLKGQENMPVFHGNYSQVIFDQTNTCAPKDQTRYMWRKIVLTNRSAPDQKALVKAKGIEIGAPELALVSFRSRATFDAAQILEFRTCPDDQKPFCSNNYARFPGEKVVIEGTAYLSALGGFTPGWGACVYHSGFGPGLGSVGVAVGGPAEVPGH